MHDVADDVDPVVSSDESVWGTEDALALSFTRRYHRDWRYVAGWGKWLVWDGQRWRTEDTGGDKELQSYLQRMVGYALTGSTQEHALFFLYGTGANGKSVFVNTLATILGDYATNAPMDTFMETRTDRHPTDMAGLRGARFVAAIETEQGKRWAESKLKNLTGGDKISARFMRQDFFEFFPQFKLFVAGNHKPAIRNIDEAMKRRLHLIPFTITVPPERRDKNLQQKLLAERDGILAWASSPSIWAPLPAGHCAAVTATSRAAPRVSGRSASKAAGCASCASNAGSPN